MGEIKSRSRLVCNFSFWLEGAWNRGQRNLTRDGSVILSYFLFLFFFFIKDRTCASQGLERFNKGYHRILFLTLRFP